MKPKILLEAGIEKHFMTKDERIAKKKLIDLLVKNHHVKYAKRLSKFDINIVPLTVKGGRNFTAAISFDEGVIYISEGFLQHESLFFQLDVLLRHELAHNLLMHQIRMMKKLGPELTKHFFSSASLHDLLNIIEDLEISNTRYTAADKEIVRKMWLNGRLISGLVTDDIRKEWLTMPVEAMYEELTKEATKVNNLVIASLDDPYGDEAMELASKLQGESPDFIYHSLMGNLNYSAASGVVNEPSRASGSLKDFISGKAYFYAGKDPETGKPIRIYYKGLHEFHQELLSRLNEIITAEDTIYSEEDEIERVITEISKTGPLQLYTLGDRKKDGSTSGKTVDLLAPEIKLLAIEFLKKASSKVRQSSKNPNKTKVKVQQETHSQEYIDSYNETIRKYDSSKYSDEDLINVITALDDIN